jgi:hypothetical protein
MADIMELTVKVTEHIVLNMAVTPSETVKELMKKIEQLGGIQNFQLRKGRSFLKTTLTLAECAIVSNDKLTVVMRTNASSAHRASKRRSDKSTTDRSTRPKPSSSSSAATTTAAAETTPTTAAETTPEDPPTPTPTTTAAAETTPTTAAEQPMVIQTKECSFTYSIREGASCATSLTEQLEEMAKEVGMSAKRAIDIPKGGLRKSFQKELPYLFTSRFRNIDPFWVGEMVLLLPWGPRQPPLNESVKVVGLDFASDPALLEFSVGHNEIMPWWPMEFCKLADPVPIM